MERLKIKTLSLKINVQYYYHNYDDKEHNYIIYGLTMHVLYNINVCNVFYLNIMMCKNMSPPFELF